MNTSARMPRYLSRRHVTLLELLVVISILALVIGFVGVNIRKAVQSQRFHSATEQFLDRVRLAQDLSLFAQLDVEVKIQKEKKGVLFWVECKELIKDKGMKRMITKLAQKKPLKFSIEEEELTLPFKSNGAIVPKGELRLIGPGQEKIITFLGYPAPLKFGKIVPIKELNPTQLMLEEYEK